MRKDSIPFYLLFFLLSLEGLYGQQYTEQPVPLIGWIPGLGLTDHAYPQFTEREQHSSFLLSYDLSDRTKIELQGFYDTYRTHDQNSYFFRTKQYLDGKWYVFSGMHWEQTWFKGQGQFREQNKPPRIGVGLGAGYEVKPNFFLEAGSNIQVNGSNLGGYGEYYVPMPTIYTLGGKLKF